jgi:hypothetical protein
VLPPASDPAGRPTPTAADVKSQLLTVADLPAGWKVDNSKGGNDNSGEPSCLAGMDAMADPEPAADITFVQADGIPMLIENIGYVGDSAKRYMSAATEALDGCTDVSFNADGDTLRGTVSSLTFPQLGDEARAWRMAFTVQGIAFDFDLAFVRKGSELLMIGYANLGMRPPAELELFATRALAKMP